MKLIQILIASAAVGFAVTSCNSDEFRVGGTVEGADNELLTIERPDFAGRWVAFDSVRTKSNGSFSVDIPYPTSPEVYRITMGDRSIYFPADSTKHIELKTSTQDFGKSYSLTGSRSAEAIAKFDMEANNIQNADADSVRRFKRKVFSEIIHNGKADILSYYVLTKSVDGKFLFDPESQEDMPYYTAVATAYKQFRPNDPHTPLLEQTALRSMRSRNNALGKQHVVEAEEVSYFDIVGTATDGNPSKLSDFASNGKPTVLVFTSLTHENSPELNRRLNSAVQGKGVNVFMVCYDDDLYGWRDAARNLPWQVVLDQNGLSSQALVNYAVTELPAIFVLNSKGELVKRVEDLGKLSAAIAPYL